MKCHETSQEIVWREYMYVYSVLYTLTIGDATALKGDETSVIVTTNALTSKICEARPEKLLVLVVVFSLICDWLWPIKSNHARLFTNKAGATLMIEPEIGNN